MTVLSDVTWCTACRLDFLLPNRGVGVLLPDGAQAALFRLDDGTLHAVGNIDPFTGAAVISRGIVGDRGGRAIVASPLKKQAFALEDGVCLDDPAVALPVYATRVTPAGDVEVGSYPAE
ncbi:nitrite reductase small subunit NirD [Mycolicibacterium rufum]|uniref:Nitrite reductase small subunit NirD n=1 Tax=Mycolicibacterium rufum TaxID=318424 RepID=A0A9X2Y552_9MYCO|nr:nitrite reductase small subunit NirD [Mycolicibacterium rufum]KGI66380.1 nitrite reductase [Mycolicibacterium rufum]MCV7074146.1 nitrite reductase small subunit NirD [Mycolicibacterium rufum]ULP37136.1 nitrite reductase small subunit NirD [Mycolicibacterium rufum]